VSKLGINVNHGHAYFKSAAGEEMLQQAVNRNMVVFLWPHIPLEIHFIFAQLWEVRLKLVVPWTCPSKTIQIAVTVWTSFCSLC